MIQQHRAASPDFSSLLIEQLGTIFGLVILFTQTLCQSNKINSFFLFHLEDLRFKKKIRTQLFALRDAQLVGHFNDA